MWRKGLICLLFSAGVFTGWAVPPAWAQVAVQSSGYALAGASQVTVASFDIADAGQTSSYLVIGAVSETSIVKEMTFDGTVMTELLGVNTDKGASGYVQFFGLATTQTAGKVSVTYSGNIWGTQIFGYAFLDGVDLAAPVRATGSGIQDPGKGTVVVTYSAGAQAGDLAFLLGNKNNKPKPSPSVSPSDTVIFSGDCSASFSGIVAYDADLAADDAYTSTFTFAAADREVVGGVILASVEGAGGAAGNPNPANGADRIERTAVLTWSPGPFVPAVKGHDVYFGETFEDVNSASRTAHANVVYLNVDANTFDPGPLTYGKEYFWRVDEVNAPPDSTIFKGAVWRFKVDPYAYPLTGVQATASSFDAGAVAQNTVNGSGLNANDEHSADKNTMWLSAADGSQPTWIRYAFDKVYKLHEMQVWNYNVSFEQMLGFGVKDVMIEYSEDGVDWKLLKEHQLTQAPGQDGYGSDMVVPFGGVAARYVRLTAKSNYSGEHVQYGLSEVRFSYVPVRARVPQPDSGTPGVDPAAVLTWKPGREAVVHKVYLSSDRQTVVDGTAFIDAVSDSSFDLAPLDLQLGMTYYWRVDEVNEAEIPSTWPGDIWSLSTPAFFAVDDFESYNDDYENYRRIFQVWIDGSGYTQPEPGKAGNNSGALVGTNEPPWVELGFVHPGGAKAMPLSYDNSASPFFSQVDRTFDPLKDLTDWTRSGVTTLVLFFWGDPANTGGQLYLKVNNTRVLFNGDPAAINRPWWTQWNVDLASTGANLRDVRTLSIGVEGNGSGKVYIDDIRLYKSAPPAAQEEVWIEAESGIATKPMDAFDLVPGASGGRYVGAELGNNSTDAPPTTGIATYTFTVKGGVYKVVCRVIAPTGSDDSLWVRIPDATMNTKIHASGWVNWNGIATGANWHWDDVHSGDDGNRIVNFTLAPGTHTLEIAYREDGLLVDALVITDKLN